MSNVEVMPGKHAVARFIFVPFLQVPNLQPWDARWRFGSAVTRLVLGTAAASAPRDVPHVAGQIGTETGAAAQTDGRVAETAQWRESVRKTNGTVAD